MKQRLKIQLDGPFEKLKPRVPIFFMFDGNDQVGIAELFFIDGELFADACLISQSAVCCNDLVDYSLATITDNETGKKNITCLSMVMPGDSTIKIEKV